MEPEDCGRPGMEVAVGRALEVELAAGRISIGIDNFVLVALSEKTT